MLALSLLGYLVAELFRGYVADSSPLCAGLSYSQFSMLMIVELCLCFLAWFLVVRGLSPAVDISGSPDGAVLVL